MHPIPNSSWQPTLVQKKHKRQSGETISILTAVEYSVERRGLRLMLEEQAGWEVVAEADDWEQAVTLARDLRPDIIVMADHMHQVAGFEAARLILKSLPDTPILMLGDDSADETIQSVVDAGVLGCVRKTRTETELVLGIWALLSGRTFFTADAFQRMRHCQTTGKDSDSPLTEREIKIIKLVSNGYTNKEIACEVGLNVRTVESSRARIMAKLGLSSLAELIRYAVRRGLIKP